MEEYGRRLLAELCTWKNMAEGLLADICVSRNKAEGCLVSCVHGRI